MMTLATLITAISVVAVLLTIAMSLLTKSVKVWVLSLLQNFCGALFVFSGYVKAVDPLGTAYKMEQYFAEFESTFAETSFSFLAPLFPWLNEYTVSFSVIMIVLEIALGVMLLLGVWRKFSAWLFFLVVAFFTVLTGFTYLTGYVPQGVNFFAFGDWGSYVETNMKVTDCGCFGDFLKLEPRTSFLKDIFLLVPALIFLFTTDKMHQLFSAPVRTIAALLTVVVTTIFCWSNYKWDIPGQDFRPFKVGVDIAATKEAEENAAASVQVLGYEIENKESGELVELTMDEYLATYQDYPEEDFDINQLTSEPEIEATKISEFELSDRQGVDVVPDLLAREGYTFFIVAYQLKGEQTGTTTEVVNRREMRFDTLRTTTNAIERIDTNYVEVPIEVEVPVFAFEMDYLDKWKRQIQPVMEAALGAGHEVVAATKYSDPDLIDALRKEIGADYDFVQGDDIMLKTIIRSNPGVLLLKDGVIVDKWHYRKLPSFEEISSVHIR